MVWSVFAQAAPKRRRLPPPSGLPPWRLGRVAVSALVPTQRLHFNAVKVSGVIVDLVPLRYFSCIQNKILDKCYSALADGLRKPMSLNARVGRHMTVYARDTLLLSVLPYCV